MEKGIILTFKELMLLLQGIGISRINGIYMEEEMVSDEEVIYILRDLEKKEILRSDKTSFEVDELMSKMLRCMGRSEKEYLCQTEDGIVYCYECEKEVLTTQLCATRRKSIELMLYEKDKFISEFGKEICNDID